MNETAYLERMITDFRKASEKNWEEVKQNMDKLEKKIDERINDQEKDIRALTEDNVKFNFIFANAGKLFWLIIGTSVSVLGTTMLQLLQLLSKH